VRDIAELVGVAALTDTDRRYLDFADAFRTVLVSQGVDESRSIEESLERAWKVVSVLPQRELTMVPTEYIERYYVSSEPAGTEQGASRNAAPASGEGNG
jgi:V/A-type H+-transporting ATPase subunit B